MPVLRELFRNLRIWRDHFEQYHQDTLVSGDQEWSLWDLEYLYQHGLPKLPARQHEAIELFLIQNHMEQECAILMGVSPTNPIGTYATDGLNNLIRMIERGELPRFKTESAA